MSSDSNSSGLMSSAGLVRYFEAEDRNAIQIDPKTLLAWSVLFGVALQVTNSVGLSSSMLIYVVWLPFAALSIGLAFRGLIQGLA